MHLVFTIGNNLKYEAKLNLPLNELLPNFNRKRINYNNKNTFKIPLNVNKKFFKYLYYFFIKN